MNQLFHTIGISKQAVQQYAQRQTTFEKKLERLVLEADELRTAHPGCGVEKMYYTLKPDFLGRDRFIEVFMQLGYRLNLWRNYRRTTYSSHIYYPNLIKGLELNAPCMVWQSDITYIQVGDRYYYGVFIIDVYTRKIVGYQVSDHMRATANMKALNMALKKNPSPRIHHSDRGSQYTYRDYTALLKGNQTAISMGLTALENAYAERIHRTIKEEYLNHWKPKTFQQLKRQVTKAVNHYNNKRIHQGLQRKTPIEFERYWYQVSNVQERPLMTIFNEELINKNGQH